MKLYNIEELSLLYIHEKILYYKLTLGLVLARPCYLTLGSPVCMLRGKWGLLCPPLLAWPVTLSFQIVSLKVLDRLNSNLAHRNNWS